MGYQVTIQPPFCEKKNATIRCILLDDQETPIPLANLATLTLQLYEQKSKAIINGRNGASILNANGGTVAATGGQLTLRLAPADMVLLSQTPASEVHVALIEWSYNGGVDKGAQEILFTVKNQPKIS